MAIEKKENGKPDAYSVILYQLIPFPLPFVRFVLVVQAVDLRSVGRVSVCVLRLMKERVSHLVCNRGSRLLFS